MRVKVSLILVLSVLAVAATFSNAQTADSRAVNTTQLAAWLTGGVSSGRLASLVTERGVTNLPTRRELQQLESCGAGKDLTKVLSSGNVQSAQIGPAIPERLVKAATAKSIPSARPMASA